VGRCVSGCQKRFISSRSRGDRCSDERRVLGRRHRGVARQGAGWCCHLDVVQVESEELAVGCEEGLFEKIEYSKIGGEAAYLPPTVNSCGVGAIVYDFVLGYDKDKLKDGPKSWADFFDTKKYPSKRSLRQGPKTTLEIALIADGVRAEGRLQGAGHDEGIERAFKKLDTIKNDIVWWKAGASRRSCWRPAKWR